MNCNKCGTQIPEGSNFCPNCGASANTSANVAEEQQFLDDTHRILRYERTAWKIGGIFFLAFGGFFAFIGVLLTVLMVAAPDAFLGGLLGGFYIGFGGVFIAVGIVNIKMLSKMDFYLERVYTDPKTVFTRANSIGMIVFCAFFSEVALIFYIINFVRMKCNKAVTERILSNFNY